MAVSRIQRSRHPLAGGRRLRALLADPQIFFLETLTLLLQPRFHVVGSATDGRALLTAADRHKPDVVVLETSLPILDGLQAGRHLKTKLPDVMLFYLTASEDPYHVRKALRIGASGFVLKTAPTSELFQAFDQALEGGPAYVTPAAFKGIVVDLVEGPGSVKETDTLTLRQKEILSVLAQGKTMKEAAASLNLSPSTVADHKYRMMKKLGVKNSAELLKYAARRGLLEI